MDRGWNAPASELHELHNVESEEYNSHADQCIPECPSGQERMTASVPDRTGRDGRLLSDLGHCRQQLPHEVRDHLSCVVVMVAGGIRLAFLEDRFRGVRRGPVRGRQRRRRAYRLLVICLLAALCRPV